MEPREELGILDVYISSSYLQCSEYASKLNRQCPHPQRQALRLGLLAGQVLEQSDNPAIIRRTRQPHRVGLSNHPQLVAIMI